MNPTNPKPTQYMNLLDRLYRQRHPDQPQPAQQPSNDTTQRRRKVRFSFLVETAAPGPLVKEEVKELWYNKREITMFKVQAQRLVLSSCVQNRKRKLNRDEIDALRGLESCTMERQMYRRKSIQCTLIATKKGMSAEEVSQIYHSCASWNKEIAQSQARHDYFTAYEPNKLHLVRRMSNVPPKFPFTMKRVSRSSSECSSSNKEAESSQFERRVRQRVGA